MKVLYVMILFLVVGVGLGTSSPLPLPPAPPVPLWPTTFTSYFKMLSWLDDGREFNSLGVQYYDYTQKAERNDHIDFCFDFSQNTTCSFYMTGNLYFRMENMCCKLLDGIGAVPPNWVKTSDYVAVETVGGVESDHWFSFEFGAKNQPLTHDYWNSRNNTALPTQYSDAGFGTPRQFSTFYEWDVQKTPIDARVFDPTYPDLSWNICNQVCPRTKAFDALAARYSSGRFGLKFA